MPHKHVGMSEINMCAAIKSSTSYEIGSGRREKEDYRKEGKLEEREKTRKDFCNEFM